MELIGTGMADRMTSGRRRRGVAIGLLVALLAGPAAHAAGTYTLPVVLPLTGGAAFLGRAERQALQLVQARANASGGIGGETLRFAFHDDESSPQVAVQLGNQLAAGRPAAIIGSAIVAMCNAMAPLMARGPVMYCLSPGIHPAAGSFVFTTSVSTFDLARALVRYFRSRGWTRIAIITSSDATGQDADRGLAQIMREGGNTAVKVVAHEHFNPTDVSVAAQIEAIKSAKPQALIAWTTGAPIATIFKGVVQGSLDIPVATTDGNMTLAQMHQYAAFLPRRLFFPSGEWVAGGAASVADAGVRKQQAVFVAAFHAAKRRPDVAAAMAWDPARTLIAGLRALGPKATAAQLRVWIAKLANHPGVNGRYDFPRVPQRGLDVADALVSRWDPATRYWVPVSGPSGKPLPH